jgi:hypothetical protein
MGQGHAGARDSLCCTGFQPRSHCRGDPYRRAPGAFGTAHEPRLVESRLHDAKGLRDLARLEGLELRALVAASSRRGASLRRCFSVTCRKRFGAGLEASVAHGAADHDHLLQRPSRHAGRAGARALRQVPLGAATGPSSLAGTTPDDGRGGWFVEVTRGRESTSQDARSGQTEIRGARRRGPPRLAKGLGRGGPPRPIRPPPDRPLPEIELAPGSPLPAEDDLLCDGRGPLVRDRRVGGDLPAVDGPEGEDRSARLTSSLALSRRGGRKDRRVRAWASTIPPPPYRRGRRRLQAHSLAPGRRRCSRGRRPRTAVSTPRLSVASIRTRALGGRCD